MQPLDSLLKILKSQGLSLTKSRIEVFLALQHPEPQTFNEIYQKLKKRLNRTTLYRTLDLFESLGVIERIQIGWKYKIELSDRFSDHHHHITCIMCNEIQTLPDDSELEVHLQKVADSTAFKDTQHQLELRGICQSCQSLATL